MLYAVYMTSAVDKIAVSVPVEKENKIHFCLFGSL
jgi:hypothetical protein